MLPKMKTVDTVDLFLNFTGNFFQKHKPIWLEKLKFFFYNIFRNSAIVSITY